MFDESDTTAPAPAPANDEDANPSAARRPATQGGWELSVNVSCLDLVVPRRLRSGS